MSVFTPTQGLIGGSIIGLSASTLLLGNGDILGASQIATSFLLRPWNVFKENDMQWRLVFLTSFLITSNLFVQYVDPTLLKQATVQDTKSPILSPMGYAIAGFLTGVGTKLGNGCTSGHGICGLARLSKRSLVAVLSFMTSGALTASFGPWPFLQTTSSVSSNLQNLSSTIAKTATWLLVTWTLFIILSHVSNHKVKESTSFGAKFPFACISAALFSIGLGISGMATSSKVTGFLNVKSMTTGTWDGTLMAVMASGLLFSGLGYYLIAKRVVSRPMALNRTSSFKIPNNHTIDSSLVVGSALFGVGWGLAGICPGPGIFLAAVGLPQVLLYWWPCYYLGIQLVEHVQI